MLCFQQGRILERAQWGDCCFWGCPSGLGYPKCSFSCWMALAKAFAQTSPKFHLRNSGLVWLWSAPLESSASSTAHQCNITIPKNPSSDKTHPILFFKTINNHTTGAPCTSRLTGSETTEIGQNWPKVPFKTENTTVRAHSEATALLSTWEAGAGFLEKINLQSHPESFNSCSVKISIFCKGLCKHGGEKQWNF